MRSDVEKRPLVIVGDSQSRRIALLTDAAMRYGFDVTVLSYADVLTDGVRHDVIHPETLVRIDSPGISPQTAQLILKAGIAPLEQHGRVPLTLSEIDQLAFDRGEILHPLQWFLGFRAVMKRLDADWGSVGARWMNPPDSIATAFDKQACRQRWAESGVPVAQGYGELKTYSQLRDVVGRRHARLFIKLRYGYSAMGAVALEWRDSLVRAITTVDVTWTAGRPRLFVTKRPRMLEREFEIAWLIDTLAMEEIVVEDWLPKARWNGIPFDLRIVTIDGSARHAVGRANNSPFTNLNLDARRIDRDGVANRLGDEWPQILSLAERAAAMIGSGPLGMDLLVRPGRKGCVVLEANAFGDYLPGLLYCGETTYEAEMRLYSDAGILV